jgi:hypothetical protein
MTDHSFLNNHAGFLLQDEKYEEAASALSVALKAIAHTIRMFESLECTNPSPAEMAESQNHAILDFLPSPAELSAHNGGDIVITGIDSQQKKMIIQDPIYINCRDGLSPYSSAQECQFHAYAIVYNVALCFHLKAISRNAASGKEDHQRNTKGLRKALALYHKAQMHAAFSKLDLPPLCCMSILSNIGHIQWCLGDQVEAEACFQLLSSAIAHFVDNGVDDAMLSQLERFLFNALPGIFHQMMITAPAA